MADSHCRGRGVWQVMYAKVIMTHHSVMQQLQNKTKLHYNKPICLQPCVPSHCSAYVLLLWCSLSSQASLNDYEGEISYMCDVMKNKNLIKAAAAHKGCAGCYRMMVKSLFSRRKSPFPLVRWDLWWDGKGQNLRGDYLCSVTCSGRPLKAAKIPIWVKLMMPCWQDTENYK